MIKKRFNNEFLGNFVRGDNVMYAKLYIAKLFNTIDEYNGKSDIAFKWNYFLYFAN